MIPVVSRLVPEVCSTITIVSFTHIPDQPLDRLFRRYQFIKSTMSFCPYAYAPPGPPLRCRNGDGPLVPHLGPGLCSMAVSMSASMGNVLHYTYKVLAIFFCCLR